MVFNSYFRNTTQTVTLEKTSGPIVNPLMGWAPWATIENSSQPHTLVYADLTWRDLEPQEGQFDFDAFEQEQQLARWRSEGKRVVFRFVADTPGDESHLDIPDWLFDRIGGRGDFYDNEYGRGFSPDYANPLFMEYHAKALRALGERYGNDDFFAFIELGSLGHWGEWHTHPEITPLPSEAIRDAYVRQYVEAFPETHLLMRRPFSIARQLGLGLYNDMTADLAQTTTWLGWIENGGDYLAGQPGGLSPMPEGWQTAPIGGEQSPALRHEQVYGTDLQQTIRLLKRSHTTFIGPNGPYALEIGNPVQEGIDEVLTSIGYRIYLERVQMPQRVAMGRSIPITLTFANDGIAPMYYNWPTNIYLLDAHGNILDRHEVAMDLRKLLPGELHRTTLKLPIDHLENGTYGIGVAILDPLTGEPGVQLANKNIRPDLIQFIGSFQVERVVKFPLLFR